MSISSCLIMIFSRWLAHCFPRLSPNSDRWFPFWGGMGEATILLLFLLPIKTFAQGKPLWEQYYEEITSVDDVDNDSWANMYDALNELATNKININKATKEDLEQLPFLSDNQIQDLLEYIHRHKRMQTLGELILIKSISWQERRLLNCFLEAGPSEEKKKTPFWKRLQYGKNEITTMLTIPFYTRKGDNNAYLGDKYKHWLRYSFSVGQDFKAGIVATKDAGEPFFKGRNKQGYDFYSFYAQMRNMGSVKNLTLGRYRLRMGLGLIMNSDYSMGKLITLNNLNRIATTIRAHSSRSSANYLQGAAATIALNKRLDLTSFISYRNIDATLNKDSLSFSTIVKTGYHRTTTEMNKKNNTSQFASGFNLSYQHNGIHVGASAVYTSLNREMKPKETIYNKWNPEGKHFWNASVDYGYTSGLLSLRGETAIDNKGKIAEILSGCLRVGYNLSLVALQRYYSYKYNALFAESFSEASGVKNEKGVYLGADWQATSKINILSYVDITKHEWPRYGSKLSNQNCLDYLAQATYHTDSWQSVLRYRWRHRQYDNEKKDAFEYRDEHRARLQFGQKRTHWAWRLQGDIAYSYQTEGSFGWMGSANAGYTSQRFSISISGGYFHTKDYYSRVYACEQGLLYSFYFPSFYGEGIRYTTQARYRFGKSLLLIAHFSTTNYFDRSKISSSYAEINRSSKSDLDLQVQYKF